MKPAGVLWDCDVVLEGLYPKQRGLQKVIGRAQRAPLRNLPAGFSQSSPGRPRLCGLFPSSPLMPGTSAGQEAAAGKAFRDH